MFYVTFRCICYIIFKILFRIKFEGIENIPKDGACIIASNHRSILDPFLLASGLKRKIIFLANKYLFDIPVVGSLIRKLDAIPLDKKKVDIKALKAALNVLECGGIIGMFPEGGIRKEGHTDITGIEEGILFLAKTSKAPIVPCNIEGSSEVLPVGKYIPKLKKVKIKFFEQIDCTQLTKEDYGYYKQLIYKYINNIQEVEDVQ